MGGHTGSPHAGVAFRKGVYLWLLIPRVSAILWATVIASEPWTTRPQFGVEPQRARSVAMPRDLMSPLAGVCQDKPG